MKKIGRTTYIVRIHFSETSTETMSDKIKRMLKTSSRITAAPPALSKKSLSSKVLNASLTLVLCRRFPGVGLWFCFAFCFRLFGTFLCLGSYATVQ